MIAVTRLWINSIVITCAVITFAYIFLLIILQDISNAVRDCKFMIILMEIDNRKIMKTCPSRHSWTSRSLSDRHVIGDDVYEMQNLEWIEVL
jgi:hypothetical protein